MKVLIIQARINIFMLGFRYQMSLETDLAKREQKEKEIREQKEEEQRRIAEQERAEIERALMASQLPPEPEEKEKDIIVVRFRLPDGNMVRN